VRLAGVGREVEDVAVAARGEHDGIGGPAADFAGVEVAGDDALGLAFDDDEVADFLVGEDFDAAGAGLLHEGRVGAEEQLLTGLAAGVERAGNLRAAEGAVGEEAAVFAGEGHALRGALVDDVDRDFGEAMDVGLAGAVVAALHGVVEEAVNAVAVVLVVLGGVDATLRGDGVRAAGRIVQHEALHLVAELGERGGGGRTGEAGAHNDDLVLPLVGGINELERLRLVLAPLLGERAGGNLGFEFGHGG